MHVEDHPMEYASFEGNYSSRGLRRRHRHGVGPRDLRRPNRKRSFRLPPREDAAQHEERVDPGQRFTG